MVNRDRDGTRVVVKQAILPPPNTLLNLSDGAPFDSWYPHQDEAAQHLLDWVESGPRFGAASLPTGSGKSVLAVITAHCSNKRTVFLTATKGLQDQIYNDFKQLGMIDIRGQNSYPCRACENEEEMVYCDEGPCHEGYKCEYRRSGCKYYDRVQEMMKAKLVITNYHYWVAQCRYTDDGLGKTDLVIMDESHMAGAAMEGILSITIRKDEMETAGAHFPNKAFEELEQWAEWAKAQLKAVSQVVINLKEDIATLRDVGDDVPRRISRAYKRFCGLEKRLGELAKAQGHWVWEWSEYQKKDHIDRGWKLTPVWIKDFTHELLYRDVPKIMMMSAVLTEKTLETLGVDLSDTDYLEMPSYFPKENNPIIHIPTVRMNYNTTPDELRQWVRRIDQIIGKRLDRKGIVFTVSYPRARFFLEHTKYPEIMITHETKTVSDQIYHFKNMEPPAVLVSPAVTSGYDFPEVFYIVIGKVPYPDTKDPVMRARHEADPTWTSWIAMDTLVQECGRAFRSPTDLAEILVVDDSWGWYYKRYKDMAPKWFQERVLGTKRVIPEPPDLDGRG